MHFSIDVGHSAHYYWTIIDADVSLLVILCKWPASKLALSIRFSRGHSSAHEANAARGDIIIDRGEMS